MKHEKKYKCKGCEREFLSKEALEMHYRAKHPAAKAEKENKNEKPVGVDFKKLRNWTIFFVLAGLVIWGVYSLINSDSFEDAPVTEVNIRSHNNLAMHIHSDLEVIIDGSAFEIPSNIGIAPGIMRPLHTHDSTGEIHIEGLYPRDFTLGEFFDVWEMNFNESCIFEHCTLPGVGAMEMFVNGEKSEAYNRLVLRDGDEILIEYNSF